LPHEVTVPVQVPELHEHPWLEQLVCVLNWLHGVIVPVHAPAVHVQPLVHVADVV
jgi:hypothetical protein